jgi:hypothetical protein
MRMEVAPDLNCLEHCSEGALSQLFSQHHHPLASLAENEVRPRAILMAALKWFWRQVVIGDRCRRQLLFLFQERKNGLWLRLYLPEVSDHRRQGDQLVFAGIGNRAY